MESKINITQDDTEGHKHYWNSDAEVKSGAEPLDAEEPAAETGSTDDVEGHVKRFFTVEDAGTTDA